MASKGKNPIRRTTSRRRKGIKNPSPPCSITSDVTSTSSSTSISLTATSTSTIPASGCCTPVSKKSRIPEMLTCPPAPKKQRVAQNIALRRRQISFFAPPDVEFFFLVAHGQQINK
ncbi:cyclin-dependent protein kinase inhibitor SMR9 [Raphanus sativus]|uniref:Cyclin-dependent protein kinase inhibitor SMR9 n=1 Tax=Raphanus sativus TaxID=3726 RepID=A0A6J0KN67_RAPSA|nr:cyclin-dependent protein kinase inhibitor SMR9 [Raphanus sativus]